MLAEISGMQDPYMDASVHMLRVLVKEVIAVLKPEPALPALAPALKVAVPPAPPPPRPARPFPPPTPPPGASLLSTAHT